MYDTLSDRELILLFGRHADRTAYEELVRRWDSRVLGFLVKASGNYEAALDLRQEVFVRLYRFGDTYNGEFAFTTWFFRIVNNALNTWRVREGKAYRHSHGIEAHTADVHAGNGKHPRRIAELNEVGAEIRRAIEQLEAAEKELLLLRLDLELSYREIAEILGEPETTIKSRFYTLLARLRTALRNAEITERSFST